MSGQRLKNQLLIVGAFRSGTTFLERLVSTNPEVGSFSQPLPLLFVELKRRFLAETGQQNSHSAYYPLNDQQFANYYAPEPFVEWLGRQRLTRDQALQILTSMAGYSGQMVRIEDSSGLADHTGGATVAEFISACLLHLDRHEPRWYWALKETTGVEEYIPYWVSHGGLVIHIVRNPVDVVRSLSTGSHGEHTGARRPLLWIARNWRKSALYALAHQAHPAVLHVDFAELTSNPGGTLAKIRAFLGLSPTSIAESDERIGRLSAWRRNSSRTGRDLSGADDLPENYARFTESWCLWEMRRLGFTPSISLEEARAQLQLPLSFEFDERPQLADMHYIPSRRDEEAARFDALDSGAALPPHVIFPSVAKLFA